MYHIRCVVSLGTYVQDREASLVACRIAFVAVNMPAPSQSPPTAARGRHSGRFLVSPAGLKVVLDMFSRATFGRCPRYVVLPTSWQFSRLRGRLSTVVVRRSFFTRRNAFGLLAHILGSRKLLASAQMPSQMCSDCMQPPDQWISLSIRSGFFVRARPCYRWEKLTDQCRAALKWVSRFEWHHRRNDMVFSRSPVSWEGISKQLHDLPENLSRKVSRRHIKYSFKMAWGFHPQWTRLNDMPLCIPTTWCSRRLAFLGAEVCWERSGFASRGFAEEQCFVWGYTMRVREGQHTSSLLRDFFVRRICCGTAR